MMMRIAAILAVIMFTVTAHAQTYDRRVTDHRLPDRGSVGSAGLQMWQFGKNDQGTPVYVTERPDTHEYRYSLAKFVTTDGRKPIEVKIRRPGSLEINLDHVYLEFEGKKIRPIKAIADGKDITKTLALRDEDCTCFDELTLVFPPTGKADIGEATIVFETSTRPVADTTPIKREDDGPKVYQTTKYFNYEPGSHRGIIEYDGTISPKDELGKPIFKEYLAPVEGGPKMPIYLWVRDDGSNLFVVLDVAADESVSDMDDKTILYVLGDGPLKSFIAGGSGGAYGKMGAAYTGLSKREHRVYEFQIPYSQLPRLNAKGKWGISFAVTM